MYVSRSRFLPAAVAAAIVGDARVLYPLPVLLVAVGLVCREPARPRSEPPAPYLVETHAARDTVSNLALPDPPAAPHPDAAAWLVQCAAHDLNNALAVVAGCGFQLDAHVKQNPPARELVRALDDAAGDAAQVVRRLSAVGRPATHRPQAVAVGDVVTRVLAHRRALLGHGVACAADHVDDGVRVTADAGQFELAVLSLVLWARDAMPNGGEIRFDVRRSATVGWVELAISVTPAVPPPAECVAPLRAVAARSGGRVAVETGAVSGVRVTIALPEDAERVGADEDVLATDESAA